MKIEDRRTGLTAAASLLWENVRARTGGAPFARAVFTLAEGLGIVESDGPGAAAGTGGTASRSASAGRS